jgi:hypothetical protein
VAWFRDGPRPSVLIQKSLGVAVSMEACFPVDSSQDEEFPSPISERPQSPHAPRVVATGVHRVASFRDASRPSVLIQKSLGVAVSMGASFSDDLSQDEEFPSPISDWSHGPIPADGP